MNSVPQDVAESKSLHELKEGLDNFTEQKRTQSVHSKKTSPYEEVSELQMVGRRASIQEMYHVSCILHSLPVFLTRHILLTAIRDRRASSPCSMTPFTE